MTNSSRIIQSVGQVVILLLHRLQAISPIATAIEKIATSPVTRSSAFINCSKSPTRLVSHQKIFFQASRPYPEEERQEDDQEEDHNDDSNDHTSNKYNKNEDRDDDDNDTPDDTIRVRIWRALAKHRELSLKELGSLVGERNLGDLQSHLAHVSRQAKTFGKKSNEWKLRRNVLFESSSINDNIDSASAKKLRKKVKILKRRGPRGQLFIRIE